MTNYAPTMEVFVKFCFTKSQKYVFSQLSVLWNPELIVQQEWGDTDISRTQWLSQEEKAYNNSNKPSNMWKRKQLEYHKCR